MSDLDELEARLAPALAHLRASRVPFWIAGGIAIDLFLGRTTRAHEDIDIQLVRGDDRALASHLASWDFQLAHDGGFEPWTPDHARHTIWCRPAPTAPWAFELLLADVVESRWVYRRDSRITRSLADIELRTPSGIPFLRPEIQLLFKAKNVRPKDEADLRAALPHMDYAAREWLRDALATAYGTHAWMRALIS